MSSRDDASLGASPSSFDSHLATGTGAPPTYATFSPVTLSGHNPSRSSHRSTILVHQKSPLLLATPPQITRALAYSHPFLLPLNTVAGLLTWSTGDPWESFLLVCAFWAIALYGDVVVTWAGPVVIGAGLIAGMYGRRYSPLSSSGWTGPRSLSREASSKKSNQAGADGSQPKAGKAGGNDKKPAKHKRGDSEITNTKHQKTLDEIVETLKEFTGRCNTLLDPMLELTDFLSTQRTPTSATTRPALTVIFMRLLIITPIWIALTVPPWRVITTRRFILVAGTVVLTWHARVMRVFRAILWRSLTVRRLAAAITGLSFEAPDKLPEGNVQGTTKDGQGRRQSELTKALRHPASFQTNHRRSGSTRTAGVKFTFIIYENQRRWIGLGWTNSLFAYERPAWTDEHNNTVPTRDDFELPEVEDGSRMEWRWVEGGRWRVDGVTDDQGSVDYDGDEGKNGWIFYDNKWQNGQRGQDGWSRWTRRRKWYRDAELVEVDQSHLPHELDASEPNPASASTPSLAIPGDKAASDKAAPSSRSDTALPLVDQTIAEDLSTDDASSRADDALSVLSTSSKSFFRSPLMRRRLTDRSATDKERTRRTSDVRNEEDASSLGAKLTVEIQKPGDGSQWGIGDEARMSLE